jgi:DNA-binding CsgD family transcriptional regulator
VLLGRSQELRQLDQLLANAKNGKSAFLVLRGEPGIGKTVLLNAARARAREMTVLSASGVETEAELPFSALADLLRPILLHLDQLPEPQRLALEGTLGLRPPAPRDPLTIYAGALSLLAAASEESPVLAIVDDTQWVDASSRAALAYVARRLRAEAIALLLATRDSDDVFRYSGLPEMSLGGLDRDEAGSLVSRVAGAQVVPSVVDRLHAATAGNPLALSEVPGLLSEAQLHGLEALDDPLPAGETITRAFLRQLEAVPAELQPALLVASASESGAAGEAHDACRLAGFDPAGLDAAEALGLVTVDAGVIRFRHPLLRSAIYHAAPPRQRRAAHAALAQVVDGERGVWHRAAAAVVPDEDVACELEEAAANARLRGGFHEAARAFERAAELTPADSDRLRRVTSAAGGYLLSGQLDHGLELLDRALASTADPHARAEIQHLRGRAQLLGGAPMEAHSLLTFEARQIEALDPDKAALMLVEATFPCFITVRLGLGVETAERAYDLSQQGDGSARLAATLRLAEALAIAGNDARARQLHRECESELAHADPLVASQVLGTYGYFLMILEEYAASRAVLTRLDVALRRNAPGALPYPLGVLSELEFRTGHWRPAEAHAFEAVRLAKETGQANILGYTLACLARIEAATGKEREFKQHIGEALELAERFQSDSLVFFGGSGHALLLLPIGQYEEALRQLQPIAALLKERGDIDPSVLPWQPELVECCVHTGRHAEAEEHVAKLEGMAESTQRPWIVAVTARCRGLLAPKSTFEDDFATALHWHEKTPTPFERARTELALGERRRRIGRRSQAREPLRAALETFDRLGARRWADLARAELRASGDSTRPLAGTRSAELTPQELQVALVVARGATNREAAEQLFLSPKTIEYHLGHVYGKLRVRSRAELARRMARGFADDNSGIGVST